MYPSKPGAAAGTTGGMLAVTGSNTAILVLIAGVLLVMGLLLIRSAALASKG